MDGQLRDSVHARRIVRRASSHAVSNTAAPRTRLALSVLRFALVFDSGPEERCPTAGAPRSKRGCDRTIAALPSQRARLVSAARTCPGPEAGVCRLSPRSFLSGSLSPPRQRNGAPRRGAARFTLEMVGLAPSREEADAKTPYWHGARKPYARDIVGERSWLARFL
jgi:hypothetical protein